MKTWSRMEDGSNISTVALRVVESAGESQQQFNRPTVSHSPPHTSVFSESIYVWRDRLVQSNSMLSGFYHALFN
jgi:hypothetical protein